MEKLMVLLHGFLGRSQDWEKTKSFLKGDAQFLAPDLFSSTSEWPGPELQFEDWTQAFHQKLARMDLPQGPRILVGYSLGGRLALQAALAAPDLWDQLILLSTNPSELTEPDRSKRIENDNLWAHRFRKDSWDSLNDDWNNQSVLASSQKEKLNEKDFSREKLALALANWSLAHQKVDQKNLEKLAAKITWLYGEKDLKFKGLMKSLPSLFHNQIFEIPESGHRLLLDQPQGLAGQIDSAVRKKVARTC